MRFVSTLFLIAAFIILAFGMYAAVCIDPQCPELRAPVVWQTVTVSLFLAAIAVKP